MLASETRKNSSVGRSYGFDLPKMLMSCTFVSEECGPENFTWMYSHTYGNCYTFNANQGVNLTGIRQVRDSGMHNGLKIEVYIGYAFLSDIQTIIKLA